MITCAGHWHFNFYLKTLCKLTLHLFPVFFFVYVLHCRLYGLVQPKKLATCQKKVNISSDQFYLHRQTNRTMVFPSLSTQICIKHVKNNSVCLTSSALSLKCQSRENKEDDRFWARWWTRAGASPWQERCLFVMSRVWNIEKLWVPMRNGTS